MKIDIHKSDDSGDILTLLEPLEVKWEGRRLVVPAGFKSDGASVPEFLWSTVSPAIDPRTIRGAVAHDYVYRHHPEGWSRADADNMFYDLIRADGLGWWRAQKCYWGVRLFGGGAWDSAENNRPNGQKGQNMERMIGTIVVLAVAVASLLLSGCLAPTKNMTTIYNPDGTVDRVIESSESVVKTVIDSTKDKLVFINDQSWLGGLRVVPPGSSAENPMGTLEAMAGKQDKQMLTMPMAKVESETVPDALGAIRDVMVSARAGELKIGADGIGSSSGGTGNMEEK